MGVRKRSASTVPSILLVDDNSNGLKARKMVLEEQGYNIVTASNGADALEHFATGRFNVVVTDYKMPRMDGLELIAKLRDREPALPIVLISGFVDALGLNEENTKADAVIQKSAHEVSHLCHAVMRLLRQKSPRKPAPEKSTLDKSVPDKPVAKAKRHTAN